MANPYTLSGRQLNIVSGARSPVVLKDLMPPKPPIRQLPLPRVLFPALKQGGV
jgi:hypothetical protein